MDGEWSINGRTVGRLKSCRPGHDVLALLDQQFRAGGPSLVGLRLKEGSTVQVFQMLHWIRVRRMKVLYPLLCEAVSDPRPEVGRFALGMLKLLPALDVWEYQDALALRAERLVDGELQQLVVDFVISLDDLDDEILDREVAGSSGAHVMTVCRQESTGH